MLTPAANKLALDVMALLGTIRINDGVVETLHDAHCTDVRIGTVWVTADVI